MIKYYSNEDLRKIKEATNYKQLRYIAMGILDKMCNEYPLRPIAMICGPISANDNRSRKENLEIFSRAIDRISAGGLLVFNQMPFENDMERIYKSDPALQGIRLLEEFYSLIFFSGFIRLMCFLPGWEKSVGATWEHKQAKRLNIPFIYLSEYYIKD